ncbi:MAG: DUF1285 domain-containing protein [Thermodesulfobacteriota bacterium]|nr:DUF1285 domain-containing protein [Thermodesulfobacteriota bacterium]
MDLPPCLIFIDKEGRWYHEGVEMIHRDFIRLFYENMELDSQDRYVINWGGRRCYVDVEDTAFVVKGVVCQDGSQMENVLFLLHLSDDTQEELLPDTLFVGKANVLYCRVKNRAFPARFNRASYYQLAQYVEEEDSTYHLTLNGNKYPISFGR